MTPAPVKTMTCSNILAIIPARKGSKRLPGKNTRLLGGKPLIEWTIDAARASKLITHLVCSTDDEAVMRICHRRGVNIIARPEHLSTDKATSEAVVLHALEFYPCDYVCLLQPTSPFRAAEDIDGCISAARLREGTRHQPDGCVSASRHGVWVPNGAVYVASRQQMHSLGTFRGRSSAYRTMPPERSIDIDTIEDFRQAEAILAEFPELLRQNEVGEIQERAPRGCVHQPPEHAPG